MSEKYGYYHKKGTATGTRGIVMAKNVFVKNNSLNHLTNSKCKQKTLIDRTNINPNLRMWKTLKAAKKGVKDESAKRKKKTH
jgi:hypothetical protein